MMSRFLIALTFATCACGAAAGPMMNPVPKNGQFHFIGLMEYWKFEIVWIWSVADDTFLGGQTVVVDRGIIPDASLLIGARFDTFLHESNAVQTMLTATGQVTSVSGTQAGAVLGGAVTTASLLADFGLGESEEGPVKKIGIASTNAEAKIVQDMLGLWATASGSLGAQGLILKTVDITTFVTQSLFYEFQITGELHSGGLNMFSATEVLRLGDLQSDLPLQDGDRLVETTYLTAFKGRFVPEPGTLALFALGLLAMRRRMMA